MRLKERKRARVEQGVGMFLWNRRTDEQVAVRHADASGLAVTSQRTSTKRIEWDTSKSAKGGSEAAREERTDKWRKAV